MQRSPQTRNWLLLETLASKCQVDGEEALSLLAEAAYNDTEPEIDDDDILSIGDQPLGGTKERRIAALLAQADVLTNQRGGNKPAQYLEAKSAANDAIAAAKALGDRRWEAHAWHAFAVSCSAERNFEDAVRASNRSVAAWRDFTETSKQGFGYLLHFTAYCLLMLNKPKEARPQAQQALQAFAAGGSLWWETEAIYLLMACDMMSGSFASASEAAGKALQRAQDAGNRGAEGLAHSMTCSYYMHMGQWQEAASAAASASRAFEDAGKGHEQVEALVMLAKAQSMGGYFALALQSAGTAAEKSGELQDSDASGKALLAITELQLKMDVKHGLDAAKSAMEWFRKEGDACFEAAAMLLASQAQAALGSIGKALRLADQALEIFKVVGNRSRQAQALQVKRNLLRGMGQAEEALEAARQSRALFRATGDRQHELEVLYSIVSDLAEQENFVEAIRLAEEGVALARDGSVASWEVWLLCLIARLQCRLLVSHVQGGVIPADPAHRLFRERTEAAQKTANKALLLAKQASLHPEEQEASAIANALFVRAEAASLRREHQAALDGFAEAAKEFEKAGDERMVALCGTFMADLYRAIGEGSKGMQSVSEAAAAFKRLGSSQGQRLAVAAAARQQDPAATSPAPADAAPSQPQPPDSKALVQADSQLPADSLELWEPDVNLVRRRIAEMACEIVGSDEAMEGDAPLMDNGMDSLSSLDFRGRISKEFGVTMPATMIFEFPTLSRLANFLGLELTAAVRSKKVLPEKLSGLASSS